MVPGMKTKGCDRMGHTDYVLMDLDTVIAMNNIKLLK